MEIAALCAVVASLRVVPDQSQFFQQGSVSLSCEDGRGNSEWKVLRNTSQYKNSDCLGKGNASYCSIEDLYPFDSGVYWCQSASRECSNAINITVTAGSVILEIPVLPVMEGEDVILRCRHQTISSNLTACFYKDDVLFGSSFTAELTILNVCKSDEGLYRCNISAHGESAEDRLTVTAVRSEPPRSTLAQVVLPVVCACISLACLILLLHGWRRKGETEAGDVSYTDVVTITQDVHPKTWRDTNATMFYAAVRPGST